MSSTLLDAGDIQRLDREKNLATQLPRQPIEEEKPRNDDIGLLLDTLAMVLERRNA